MNELHELPWPRRTQRLSLRPPTDADLVAMFEYRSRADVTKWITAAPADLDTHLAQMAGKRYSTLVIETDQQLVGDLMLRRADGWGQAEMAADVAGVQAELGWCLHPDAQGRGIATEAVSELLAIAFDGLGLRRVVAGCFADNEASWRLMEKVGMRREGFYVAESLHRELGWVDGIEYALLADEWQARRNLGR